MSSSTYGLDYADQRRQQHDHDQHSYQYGAAMLYQFEQAALIVASRETPALCVTDDEARNLAGSLADTLLLSAIWRDVPEVIGLDLARRAAMFVMLVSWGRE